MVKYFLIISDKLTEQYNYYQAIQRITLQENLFINGGDTSVKKTEALSTYQDKEKAECFHFHIRFKQYAVSPAHTSLSLNMFIDSVGP